MGPPENPGVNRRAIRELFNICEERDDVDYSLEVCRLHHGKNLPLFVVVIALNVCLPGNALKRVPSCVPDRFLSWKSTTRTCSISWPAHINSRCESEWMRRRGYLTWKTPLSAP